MQESILTGADVWRGNLAFTEGASEEDKGR